MIPKIDSEALGMEWHEPLARLLLEFERDKAPLSAQLCEVLNIRLETNTQFLLF